MRHQALTRKLLWLIVVTLAVAMLACGPALEVASPTPLSLTALAENPQQFVELPSDPPVREWSGIPIPTQALHGTDRVTGYAFVADANLDEIITFYRDRLPRLGWEEIGQEVNADGSFLMLYRQDHRDLLFLGYEIEEESLEGQVYISITLSEP